MIPKNTSLIIARVPLAVQPKKSWDPTADKNAHSRIPVESEVLQIDLLTMNGSEEDKIAAMMKQSTGDYDSNK